MKNLARIGFIPLAMIVLMLVASAFLGVPQGQADEEELEEITCTAPATTTREWQVTTRAAIADPSIAIDACSRFIIAFREMGSGTNPEQRDVRFMRFNADCTSQPYSGEADGSAISKRSNLTGCVVSNEDRTNNYAVSIAMGNGAMPGTSPPIFATWTANLAGLGIDVGPWQLRAPATGGSWLFDQGSPPPMFTVSTCGFGSSPGASSFNSSGISDGVSGTVRTTAWTRNATTQPGIIVEAPAFNRIRTCNSVCFTDKWAPCISTRATGESVVV